MHRERANAYKLVIIQALIVIVITAIFTLSSFKAAYSVSLGGACCVVPSLYFAHKLFRYVTQTMNPKAMRAFYRGEVIKLVLIGVLSVLVFKFIPILPLNFFIGFVVAQFAFWIVPNFLVRHKAAPTGGAA